MAILRLMWRDCLDYMGDIQDESIDAVVCDPPYGLSFMGKEWDKIDQDGRGRLGGALGGQFADGSFRLPIPSYTGRRRNVKCPDCGKWAWDHLGRNCICGGITRLQQNIIQKWHRRWLRVALRILVGGGTLKVFGGSRTFHRLAMAMRLEGFRDIKIVAWSYGNGFPKGLHVGKAVDAFVITGRVTGEGLRERTGCHWSEFPNKRARESRWTSSTGEAKAWNGWGTSLKPAWEPVIMGRKP